MSSAFFSLPRSAAFFVFAISGCLLVPTRAAATADWQAQHAGLVARLRALAANEGAFGDVYQPLYHAALPWYEQFGGNPQHGVDEWMVPPEQYATELAESLENGRNFFADQSGALVPLVFEWSRQNGGRVRANYWLSLPRGFGEKGRSFPLIIGLHGSGWLGHKLSFVRPRAGQASGPAIQVTPINEQGPWQIDFLNAYLDELLRILPVDVDRVYVEGHSLGGMATWAWAEHNPERFAAISPRSAVGEPFRASRLKHVPAWVIHGENDVVIPAGFADQMVTALEDVGASVRYTVLKNVEHNMPDDLDQAQVVDWYLRQTRSRAPVPDDPFDRLGIGPEGFSRWETIERTDQNYWHTGSMDASNLNEMRSAAMALFKQAHDLGERAPWPIFEKRNAARNETSFWLPVPKTLRRNAPTSSTAAVVLGAKYARFYFRGPSAKAFAHLAAIAPEIKAAGASIDDSVWINWLTMWRDQDSSIAEYMVMLK
jgi:pimeloyl-ACP methyl ester carboxylesterase